jgi:uncharacterized protein
MKHMRAWLAFQAAVFFSLSCVQVLAAPVGNKIAVAAMAQVGVTTQYDPSYVALSYPNGDVPPERGVCADVVVRALRQAGVDLQVEVHEDMLNHFKEYPNHWGLKKPDKNIDHRRVPNLMRFFERKGKSLSLKNDKTGYRPGDVVAWKLSNGLYHIGIVGVEKVPSQERYFMIHNIGQGARNEDVLKAYIVIGHYRWE